jgi:hypothetical protein
VFRRPLITAAVVALAAGASILVPTASVSAQATPAIAQCNGAAACVWLYYKDPSLGSPIVGDRMYTCAGQYIQRGGVTPFYSFSPISC